MKTTLLVLGGISLVACLVIGVLNWRAPKQSGQEAAFNFESEQEAILAANAPVASKQYQNHEKADAFWHTNTTLPNELAECNRLPSEGKNDELLQSLLRGMEAIRMIAQSYLDLKEIDKAKQVITSNKTFAKSRVGKETLAKVYIAAGERSNALEIYQSIKDESPEAKSFLAQEAFDKKDFSTARKYTEELLLKFPDNQVLQDNLKSIQAVSVKGKG